jgi:hypothetical protein
MILTPIPRDKLAHTLDRFMAGLHDRFSRAVFRQIRATFAGTRRRSGGGEASPRGALLRPRAFAMPIHPEGTTCRFNWGRNGIERRD